MLDLIQEDQMGTDIHSIVQVRKKDKWVTVGVGVAGDSRSYNTFAMLANVRNGRGFAGVKTSDGFPVIHEQRGLPEDLEVIDDDQVKIDRAQIVAAWNYDGELVPTNSKDASRLKYMDDDLIGLGDHSFSWATLAELHTFVANVASNFQSRLCGIVDRSEYIAAKAEGRNYNSWCGGISGPDIVIADEPAPGEDLPECTHVRAIWTVPAMQCSCLGKIVTALVHVREVCNVEAKDVRYVFGYDS